MEITYGGQSFRVSFCFSQREVDEFARITGDTNPIHTDQEYAAGTPFKRPIIHGYLSTSIFSRVFGTMFPGEGTIYLEQSLKFLAPMYVDTGYTAVFNVTELLGKHRAKISTTIIDNAEFKEHVTGSAVILNKQKII